MPRRQVLLSALTALAIAITTALFRPVEAQEAARAA